MDKVILKVKFAEACERAQERSKLYACGTHVNAEVGIVDGIPEVTGFHVSDWFSDSTLRSFSEGRQL